ncbi:uncharacterized protein [Physcomitrium patens]|nr:guanylate-binding protein 2-like isoform X3 [Physcomitrium patens]|eukprot:XP_024393848.1 guanylate-binding protein 2-like isoform X3 [Physcomitrella patens]
MWSSPLKRTAPDGSEYSLLLLDSEGIDAYDQTGTYSTQIFSLAVLLSSMFVYNQMGGIDEAALDKLSLVTEMTKHIQVRASSSRGASASEIGQFSPLFLWLLRDFYLDLTEDGHRITPRDYLESALQSIPGAGKAISSKNEIRSSIRALFPERDCFTLVRPLNDEKELQKLDQINMEKMRPEFRVGLDALTKYIFERTRPKQLGTLVMNGPMFAGLTQSFLDAINAGAVPTISTSWQNVEENECRRAHDMAVQKYSLVFNKDVTHDEVALQEAQEEAVQAAFSVYNSEAVGNGVVRRNHEKQLHATLKRQFEDFKRKSSMEAELKCLRAVGIMEEKLRNACNAPDATFESVTKVLDEMVVEYESQVSGLFKYQKLVQFMQKSLTGPVHDLVKRASDKAATEYQNLVLKGRSMGERLAFSAKQTEAAQREAQDWKKRYENIMNDYNRASENAAAQYANVQKKVSSLEERRSNLLTQLEGAKKEALDWHSKYEQFVAAQRAETERLNSEIASLQNRTSTAEARLAALREQSESVKFEAVEWQRKYEAIASDTKAAVEKATAHKERALKQAQLREDSMRAEHVAKLSDKEQEVKELQAKLEQGERRIVGLITNLHEIEFKTTDQSEELVTLRSELKCVQQELESTKSQDVTLRRDLEKAEEDKAYAERRMNECIRRMEEAEQMRKIAERDAKRAIEAAEKSRAEAITQEREKLETQKLAAERMTEVERIQRRCQVLEQERDEMVQNLEEAMQMQQEAVLRVSALESQHEDREKEMENLLSSSQEQRAKTVEAFEKLLASERAAKAEASQRAESLSLQIQHMQGQIDNLQGQLTAVRNHEIALETRVRGFTDTPPGKSPMGSSRSKRPFPGEGFEASAQDMDIDASAFKRNKMDHHFDNASYLNEGEEGGSGATSSEIVETTNYRKLTIAKLKQRMTEAGFGAEVLATRNPSKKELLEMYERLLLNKPPAH